jgi:hypothetical protein
VVGKSKIRKSLVGWVRCPVFGGLGIFENFSHKLEIIRYLKILTEIDVGRYMVMVK